MLDVSELDASLKLRALGRLFTSNHPFLKLIREKLDLSNFFGPRCCVEVERVTIKGLDLLQKDRDKLWADSELNSHAGLISTIANTKIKDILSQQGRDSVTYFMLRRQYTKVGELRQPQLDRLIRYIGEEKREKISRVVGLNILGRVQIDLTKCYIIKGWSKPLMKCTSKEIRSARSNEEPLKEFKIGLDLSVQEAATWGLRLTKLTSIRHRATLLKIAHNDVYTKVKLARFGLIDQDKCPRCDDPETLEHKIFSCTYTSKIWNVLYSMIEQDLMQDPIKSILGARVEETMACLTIKAEILNRLLQLRDDQNYLIHPKNFVINAIRSLSIKEITPELKEKMLDLLM